ncbi:MAG: aspartate aminotransferase family protein [Thermodesulfobacteriota bacterium]|nr:aspartate aminotransferase family protein [Thermodesulfobacteriota bacterium]
MDTVKIPKKGIQRDKVLEQMQAFRGDDANYHDSKTWSLVYYLGEEHTDFLKKAYAMYFSENALNPMAFKSLKRFESEVVRMAADLLNGDDNTVGVMTSGGTESCLLPVVTYRDMARKKRRFIRPEMIAPQSVHVAWEKAAHYFNVKMVHAPLMDDFRVDVDAVKKLINRNTIMIVGSAPSYPHGVLDPIGELGELAEKRGVPLHVDSCLGGFFLPFVKKLGYPLEPFDFTVPGVTSISADVHKYGYSAKGASVILYRNMDYMRHQFFVHADWPGGVFASPALLGTRPGGAIAAAWASIMAMGEDGYLEATREVMDTTARLIRGIEDIDSLKIMGNPIMGVFAYTGKDIFAVGDGMEDKGWHIDRLQRPNALHAMVTPRHKEVVDLYLEDLRSSLRKTRDTPGLASRGNAAMYGMIADIPFRRMIRSQVLKMMEDMYGPKMVMPMDSGGDESRIKQWLVALALRIFQSPDKL